MRKAVLAFVLLLPAALALAGKDEVFEKAFSLEGVSRISVQNVNGRIEASAWDRPYLRVRAAKTGTGLSDETLRQTEIRVSKRGSEIDVETILPKRGRLFGVFEFGGERGAEVSYEILLPPAMAVDVETVNGRDRIRRRADL